MVKICYNYTMKKFDRTKHKNMGVLPDALRQMVVGRDIATATNEFNAFMTAWRLISIGNWHPVWIKITLC